MDSAHQDHDDKCIEETTSDQLLHPDSPDINDIFGEPLVHPRVGYEYQVEIPLMITESERDKLLVNPADAEVIVDVSHSFLMGLPIPIVQESTATSPDSKVMGSTDLDQMHGSKSYLTVPGSLGDSWSDIEVDSFILGLYIFGKNLIQEVYTWAEDFYRMETAGIVISFASPGLTGMPKYTAGGVNYSLFLLQCVPTKLLCY
ncbi:hypothetical protein CK203_111820 [Vitis vinifera]|uniref:Uncharacterized protein n=1 Tax=Vitis vinifera TaxID=29760 RepID=A0A438FKF8_VITVI|nr:hypothetical protein CK203_111820 [Vitis vinifera]